MNIFPRLLPLLLAVSTLSAEAPSIHVTAVPRLQFAGKYGTGSVSIRVTVPRNAQNRSVCVFVDGPLTRTSCWDQVGAEAPFRQEFAYQGLPAGRYTVSGVLEFEDGAKGGRKTVGFQDRFVVLGEGEVE